MALSVNASLVVSTATMWHPVAFESVFKAINLGSENNCIQLVTNGFHEFKKGQHEHCFLVFYQIIPSLVFNRPGVAGAVLQTPP